MSHIFQITVAHDVIQIWRLAPSDHRNLLVTSHALIIRCYKSDCAFSSYLQFWLNNDGKISIDFMGIYQV